MVCTSFSIRNKESCFPLYNSTKGIRRKKLSKMMRYFLYGNIYFIFPMKLIQYFSNCLSSSAIKLFIKSLDILTGIWICGK